MNSIDNFRCESENVNLDDYLHLYKYVRENMNHPEWLGTFSKEEIEDIFTKVCKDNIYSINNVIKNNYKVVDEYESERGINLAFLKEVK